MTGLMIKFREPNTAIGLIVMVEVFHAICGGTLVICEQLAVMAAVPHENLAVGLALLGMITQIGGSVGQTISTAIWTQIVPARLERYLPEELKVQAPSIYASLPTQLAYAWDSVERQAIVKAYGDAQKLMVITGTCALLPCIIWVLMLKNHKLSGHSERKGLLL